MLALLGQLSLDGYRTVENLLAQWYLWVRQCAPGADAIMLLMVAGAE